MSEESTTADPVELVNRWGEAANRRDFDPVGSIFRADAVWDLSLIGLGTYEGIAAIRGLFEDWIGAYDELHFVFEALVEIGNGVLFTLIRQKARPPETSAYIHQRESWVWEW